MLTLTDTPHQHISVPERLVPPECWGGPYWDALAKQHVHLVLICDVKDQIIFPQPGDQVLGKVQADLHPITLITSLVEEEVMSFVILIHSRSGWSYILA